MTKLGEKPKIRFERDGERYIVMLGDDRIGFVRSYFPPSRIRRGRASVSAQWNATDTFMRKSQNFPTRRAAGDWLQKETERAIRAGEI